MVIDKAKVRRRKNTEHMKENGKME